jgi:DNA-binding LacI/PurR family transcriptional regulator
MFSPRLTVVAQPSYEIGKIAMESLLQAIEPTAEKHQHPKGTVVRLQGELRIRESTAPPPADTPPVEDEQRREVNSPVRNLSS